ncbi:MAG: serpin family protein [Gemmataceae bacterium]
MKAVADSNNAFTIDLYQKLAEENKGNIIVSPYSISTALTMTYAGAKGQTAEEMANVLHFTLPQDQLHSAIASTGRQITKSAGSGTVDIANSLWVRKGRELSKPFANLMERHYEAGVQDVEFGNPKEAAKRINAWVATQTRDKIPELLKPKVLSPQTQLVLVNAIYLNCKWAVPFPPSETQDERFEWEPGRFVKVPMMRFVKGVHLRLASTPDFQMLELPYKVEKIAMHLILPNPKTGLAHVEKNLTTKVLSDAVAKLHTGKTKEVAIPRFTSRSSFNLNNPLHKLGMKTAFGPGADFSGLFPGGCEHIGAVIHEAFVEVDEQGTVATAATAVVMLSSDNPEIRFRADRPFLFLIVEQTSGTVLFLGRCVNPNERG